MRQIVENGNGARATPRDGRLVTLLVKAQQARRQLIDGGSDNACTDAHLARMARLAFLAPDIVAAIREGSQPPGLTARQLLRAPTIPHAWADQRRMFGFS